MSETQDQAPVTVSVAGQKNSVEIFLGAFEKAIRSARVYAYESGQHLLDQIYQNVTNALDRAFMDEDEIDVQIRPTQMLFDRKVVYENKDKKSSLARNLHDNGIRVVHFKKGLVKEELVKIIEILATDFSDPEYMDQDLYCCFVESPLDHFEVVGSDILGELVKDNAELKEELAQFQKRISSKETQKFNALPRRHRQDDLKVLEEFQLRPQQFARSDEEVSKIVKSVTAPHVGEKREKETLERLALMGFHFLLQENEVDQTQVGRELVGQVAIMMLEERYIELFRSLTRKINQLHRDRAHQRGEYQKILDSIFSVDHFSLYRERILEKESQLDVVEVLLSGPPSTVRLLIKLLGLAPWCQKTFSVFIAKHAAAESNWINEEASRAPDQDCWEAFMNIISVNPHVSFGKFMSSLLSSANPSLQLKILKQCAVIGSSESLDVFRAYLSSNEEEERRLAYRMLPHAKNKKALAMLVGVIESKEFSSFDPQEKEDVYRAVLHIGGDASYSWFEAQWFKAAEGIFKSKNLTERRGLLVRAAKTDYLHFIEQVLEKEPLEKLSKDLQELIHKARTSQTGEVQA